MRRLQPTSEIADGSAARSGRFRRWSRAA